MKLIKSITPITCMLLFVCIFASCTKSSSNSSTTVPTNDEAADIASSSIELGGGGFADQAGAITTISTGQGYGISNPNTDKGKHQVIDGGPFGGLQGRLTCGVPFDTTVTYSYSGPNVTASITHQWILTLDCVNNDLTFTGSFQGSYDGPYISGSRTGNRNWVLTGFGTTYDAFTVNGTFNCNGVWTMKAGSMNTYNNTVAITGTNVTVDKTTHRITGGTGTVNITSVVSNGKSYQFTGTIVFNGDHTATLTINGNTYTILI